MTVEDALKLLLSKLKECEIPYMITGSFASNTPGLPRATQDADVVIEVDKGALKRLLENPSVSQSICRLIRSSSPNALVPPHAGQSPTLLSNMAHPSFHDSEVCFL